LTSARNLLPLFFQRSKRKIKRIIPLCQYK
jgi:hypothetical protein